jgi:hypothetical protein
MSDYVSWLMRRNAHVESEKRGWAVVGVSAPSTSPESPCNGPGPAGGLSYVCRPDGLGGTTPSNPQLRQPLATAWRARPGRSGTDEPSRRPARAIPDGGAVAETVTESTSRGFLADGQPELSFSSGTCSWTITQACQGTHTWAADACKIRPLQTIIVRVR